MTIPIPSPPLSCRVFFGCSAQAWMLEDFLLPDLMSFVHLVMISLQYLQPQKMHAFFSLFGSKQSLTLSAVDRDS